MMSCDARGKSQSPFYFCIERRRLPFSPFFVFWERHVAPLQDPEKDPTMQQFLFLGFIDSVCRHCGVPWYMSRI